MFQELIGQLDITNDRIPISATKSVTLAGRNHL
jgi:hypothetical protein